MATSFLDRVQDWLSEEPDYMVEAALAGAQGCRAFAFYGPEDQPLFAMQRDEQPDVVLISAGSAIPEFARLGLRSHELVMVRKLSQEFRGYPLEFRLDPREGLPQFALVVGNLRRGRAVDKSSLLSLVEQVLAGVARFTREIIEAPPS